MTNKLVPSLASQYFNLKQQVCLEFDVRPYPGVTIDDVMKPEYWKNIANQLKVDSEIQVRPLDNSWYALLTVDGLQRLNDIDNQPVIGAYVGLIYYIERKPKVAETVDGYEIRSTNNNTKFGVFRKSDGRAMKTNMHSEKQAQDFLEDLTRVNAA